MFRGQFLLLSTVAVLTAMSPALAAGASSSPCDFVKDVYAFSAGKDGKWSGRSAYTDEKARARFLSKSLLQSIIADEKKSQGEEGAVDYDPISNSQDPSINNLTYSVVSTSADAAIVKARFTLAKDAASPATEVSYDLIREEGAWKINDIRGAGPRDRTEHSVRKLLNDAAKP